MAVVTIYRLQYQDFKEQEVRVEIRGEETLIPPGQSPNKLVSGRVFIDYPEVDNHRTPIRGSGLRLDLQADNFEDFGILWTEQERQFTVNVTVGGAFVWGGYIKPDGIFFDYTKLNYNLSIDAIDGLGFLEDLAYVDADTGLNYTGLRKPIKIISDCLRRFGSNSLIRTLPNIRYNGLIGNVDILDNTYLKVDRYIRDDENTTGSAQEVLEGVLSTFGMCIIRGLDAWYVYDPEVIAKGVNNTYFQYNFNGNADGTYTITQTKNIGSQVNGFALYHINSNQRLEMRPSISGVRVNYKYGLDESLINNEFLEHNGTTYSGWTINDATKHAFGPNNKGALISHDESVVVMTADAISVAQDDLIKVELRVANTSVPAATRVFSYRVRIGTTHYLKRGQWSTSAWTETVEVLSGFERSVIIDPIEGIPVTGTLIVEIMGFEFVTTTQGNMLLSRFSISPGTEEGGLRIQGENHTVQIPGGSVAEDPIEVPNGDNPSELYYGTIYKNDQNTPTDLWSREGKGEESPILRLFAEKVVRMNQKPARYFSGDVYDLLGPLNLITIDGLEGKYMILGYSYDTQKRTASMVIRQIYTDELVGEAYELTYDYGNTVKPTIVG